MPVIFFFCSKYLRKKDNYLGSYYKKHHICWIRYKAETGWGRTMWRKRGDKKGLGLSEGDSLPSARALPC